MNLAMSVLLAAWCLVVIALVAWCVYVNVRADAAARRARRQVIGALESCVRDARDLIRVTEQAQVVHAHHVFALHRERQEGIRARA